MGNFKSSYDYLDRAYKTRPDPEIAAHLGEVLWAEGKREEAEKLWRAALKENPDNASLRTTIEKHLR
jgi:tetratricopeptide (TPR) repeat protein